MSHGWNGLGMGSSIPESHAGMVPTNLSTALQQRYRNVPVNNVDAHDEGLHFWAGGVAELALGVGAEHRPVAQGESIRWAEGCATCHH